MPYLSSSLMEIPALFMRISMYANSVIPQRQPSYERHQQSLIQEQCTHAVAVRIDLSSSVSLPQGRQQQSPDTLFQITLGNHTTPDTSLPYR